MFDDLSSNSELKCDNICSTTFLEKDEYSK